jgi:CheY-like chemotaxis protein
MKELGRAVHLVITDVIMPDMGGVMLANRLRKEHASIPFLFVSGYSEQGGESLGTVRRGDLFLQKPFSPYQLAKKVREVLDAKSPGRAS